MRPALISASRSAAAPLLLAACLLPAGAQAQEKMTWLMPDVPPASMPVNGQPTNGIADQVVRFIAERWPGAEHRYIYANAKRTWLMLEKGEPVCVAAALRTPERERFAHFTITNLVPPIQLIAQEETIARLPLNALGEVDLPRALASQALRGIVVERRSYGPAVDAMIAKRPPTARLETTSVGDYGRNVLKLVAHGRADYTIDYDYSLQYSRQSEPGMGKLRAVPIAGNNRMMVAGLACPRNAWGRAAARRIDAIIGTREGAEAMLKAQNTWHTEATQQRYARELQEFQRQRARPNAAFPR